MPLFLCTAGCEAVFERDISKDSITVKSPQDGYCSNVSKIYFWWDELKGAENYHVQLVSPSFDTIREFILDTLMSDTRIELYLDPGRYQWRIRAQNSAYHSNYTTMSFSIVGTEDLSQQSIHLLMPADNDTTKLSAQQFMWDSVPYAANYRIEIWQPDLSGTQIHSALLTSHQTSFTFANDGLYLWRVRAENQSSITSYASRQILIDTHIPSAPELISPANNATLSISNVLFQWKHDTVAGSIIHDSLKVASDYLCQNTIINIKTTAQTYSDSIPAGTWYWKVKSADAAGNTGNWSTIFQFIVP
jgi:uncharacterized protein YegP (UPF0339 family)